MRLFGYLVHHFVGTLRSISKTNKPTNHRVENLELSIFDIHTPPTFFFICLWAVDNEPKTDRMTQARIIVVPIGDWEMDFQMQNNFFLIQSINHLARLSLMLGYARGEWNTRNKFIYFNMHLFIVLYVHASLVCNWFVFVLHYLLKCLCTHWTAILIKS